MVDPERAAAGEESGDEAPARPGPSAVDTHCHLFLMESDPSVSVAAARAAGVGALVCVGVDQESSRRSLEIAESFPGVFAAAGVHPHDASAFDRATGAAIEQLVGSPLVVGIGETGLDYFRELSPREEQRRAFRAHIGLSRETGKPLVVHIRDAWEDAYRILEEERAERVVLHCFTGDEALAVEAAARGYHLSFAANVTYPNAGALRRAAAAVPEDRLLLETDSPFLPPQSMRGRPNRPESVLEVAAVLAAARGLDVERMLRRTTGSAFEAFPLMR